MVCHDSCALQDSSWTIIKPCLVIGDIVKLDDIKRNIVIEMVF